MRRRQFLRAATVSLMLPAVLRPAAAAIARSAGMRDYIFFDRRFPRARQVAGSWSDAGRLVEVHGDVTPVMNDLRELLARNRRLNLRGVTTESFHFCLRILLAEYADLDWQASRLDPDLFVWVLCANLKITAGVT